MVTMIADKFHINIRKFRESKGLSQSAMAEELGIGRTTYINFERGKTRLFCKTLYKFAKYMGVKEEDILFATEGVDNILRDHEVHEDKYREMVRYYEDKIIFYEAELQKEKDRATKLEEMLKRTMETNSYLLNQLPKNY